MIRAVAIETSGRVGSIAAVLDGEVVGEQEFPHGLRHAAQIVPILDRLVRERGWGPGKLDELYVSAGPGSFTGLRIGITLAKTLSLATGVKVVAAPTVRVLVENAPAEAREVIIALDAKREQIFTARFERGDRGWDEREPAHVDRLTEILARSGRPVHLLGEGIPYHRQFIPEESGVVVTPEALWRARAGAVAKIGFAMARRGEFADVDRLTPIYIRRPEAEEKWESRRANE